MSRLASIREQIKLDREDTSAHLTRAADTGPHAMVQPLDSGIAYAVP
jgi:hypothetical protein